jgi:hypothetical protein
VRTWSSIGGSYRTAWFTEPDRVAGVERITAVVVRPAHTTASRSTMGAELRKGFAISNIRTPSTIETG